MGMLSNRLGMPFCFGTGAFTTSSTSLNSTTSLGGDTFSSTFTSSFKGSSFNGVGDFSFKSSSTTFGAISIFSKLFVTSFRGSSLTGDGSLTSGVGLFLTTSTLLLFTTCSSFGSGWLVNTSNKSLPFSPLLFNCFFFSAADTFLVLLLELLVACSSSAPPTPAFLLITSTKGLQSTAFSSTTAAGLASSQGKSGRGVGDTGSYRGSSPLMPSSVVTLSVSCTCFIGTAAATS